MKGTRRERERMDAKRMGGRENQISRQSNRALSGRDLETGQGLEKFSLKSGSEQKALHTVSLSKALVPSSPPTGDPSCYYIWRTTREHSQGPRSAENAERAGLEFIELQADSCLVIHVKRSSKAELMTGQEEDRGSWRLSASVLASLLSPVSGLAVAQDTRRVPENGDAVWQSASETASDAGSTHQ